MAFTLYSAGNYDNPIGPQGRARTLAAFHVAQNAEGLDTSPMRRDVLVFLMSPSAVGYWLNQQGWLEKCGERAGVALLRLTARGLAVCEGSLSGLAMTNTNRAFVEVWRRRLVHGDAGACIEKEFEGLLV